MRFGFTVGKANAHRSGDIVVRLKRRIPKIGQEVSLSDFKKKLREECDLAFKIFARRALVHWEAHR